MVKDYIAGIYIRLSKEDIDKNEESVSVTNQKNMLEKYIKEKGYTLYNTYVDDGFTGTNFNRPAFIQMIKDIEANKINMVITKDLSRLGRDYIETGAYIEKFFPTHNVRYISLLDGIDTINDNSNNDIAPFKAVINDMYSKDNSKKIRTALKAMQLKGKWVGGCPPFGYMKDPFNNNHLIINEEEAKIVKEIFLYAEKGNNYYQIAEILTNNNVPTSSMLRNNKRRGIYALQGIWSPKTIKKILSNEMYTGNMVQNRTNRISYKIRKNKMIPKERWIIVKNTHEPIIDYKRFKNIQNILLNCKIRQKKEKNYLLDGLLYCHECGHKISISNKYTTCNLYKMNSKKKICTSHTMNYYELEKIITSIVNKIIKKRINDNKIINKINEKIKSNNEIKTLITLKEKRLDRIYLDYIDNKIDFNMYERLSKKTKNELEELNKENKPKILNKEEYELIINNNKRNIILKIINKIEIYENKRIDIIFKT